MAPGPCGRDGGIRRLKLCDDSRSISSIFYRNEAVYLLKTKDDEVTILGKAVNLLETKGPEPREAVNTLKRKRIGMSGGRRKNQIQDGQGRENSKNK